MAEPGSGFPPEIDKDTVAEDPADEVPEFYVNAVSFEATLYDILMSFAVTRGKGGARPLVRIRMTPQHELMMIAFLLKHIAAYEAQTGIALHLPDRVVQGLGIADALAAIRKFTESALAVEREKEPADGT